MGLFKKQEYQKTTIEEIVNAAGVSKPTFFAYFKSKEQILYEFDQQQLRTFEEELRMCPNHPDALLQTLREAIVRMAVKLHSTPMLTQNIIHLLTINEDNKELLRKIFTIFHSVTKKVIVFGQQNQLITTGLLSDEIVKDILNIYTGSLVNWVISNGTESLEALMGNSLEHYLNGISLPKVSDDC